MVDYNMGLLNRHDLAHSFFCLSKDDPTIGFEYDASSFFGPTYPSKGTLQVSEQDEGLRLRLVLGSHLARHLRHELESQKGYTATVGIATNKLLSKLVGNVNKPKSQTTIVPPYHPVGDLEATVTQFLDGHDIGKIPGIGSKLAHKIRGYVLGRDAAFSEGLVYGATKESVTVLDVRTYPGMGPELLEEILGTTGSPRGIGGKVWELIHGIDDTEVGKAKRVPSQISQEDSYMKYLHTLDEVKKQLQLLGERLIRRMQMDLLEDEDDGPDPRRRWMAHPRTLRLSTRPRPLPGPDGVRARTFNRISRSAPMPNYVFNLNEPATALATRLVDEALIPMFRKLHHEKAGWNLSLINIAATNMAETAAESKDSAGRDIGRMFRRQDEVLKDFRITDEPNCATAVVPQKPPEQISSEAEDEAPVADGWDTDDSDHEAWERCESCQSIMPAYAFTAHRRFHELGN
ncbi:DNA polymerase iota [Cladophialophora carrionii]|uniref:DNA polymerase iota n=1 Tax=Cladophialophora carrionii TaxID=86049 RepID=A0A1C1C6Y6_9EURO|nr:DNA polymerase iota [Cladophialophora carrionii]